MFEGRFGELLIIFVLALVILGPEKLPKVVAEFGRWVGRARTMARQFREQLEEEVRLDEVRKAQAATPSPAPAPPPESVPPAAAHAPEPEAVPEHSHTQDNIQPPVDVAAAMNPHTMQPPLDVSGLPPALAQAALGPQAPAAGHAAPVPGAAVPPVAPPAAEPGGTAAQPVSEPAPR
jgi:sec-independent protein translocase protein TatB